MGGRNKNGRVTSPESILSYFKLFWFSSVLVITEVVIINPVYMQLIGCCLGLTLKAPHKKNAAEDILIFSLAVFEENVKVLS